MRLFGPRRDHAPVEARADVSSRSSAIEARPAALPSIDVPLPPKVKETHSRGLASIDPQAIGRGALKKLRSRRSGEGHPRLSTAKKVGLAVAGGALVLPTAALGAHVSQEAPSKVLEPSTVSSATVPSDTAPSGTVVTSAPPGLPPLSFTLPGPTTPSSSTTTTPTPPPTEPPAPAAPAPIGDRPEGNDLRADWYRRIVERQGGTWKTGANEVNVIGLRGFDVDAGRDDNAFNQWNDTIAFVWRDDAGAIQIREYRATTDPGEKTYYDSNDVDGDGVGDVAWLEPGQYEYVVGTHHGVFGAGNPTINVPVARDTSHDGQIQPEEDVASRARDDRGYGINIHWGPGADVPVDNYSTGCQVLNLTRADFQREVTPILKMGPVLYTLVDMQSLA